jgi:hypothetical protein
VKTKVVFNLFLATLKTTATIKTTQYQGCKTEACTTTYPNGTFRAPPSKVETDLLHQIIRKNDP